MRLPFGIEKWEIKFINRVVKLGVLLKVSETTYAVVQVMGDDSGYFADVLSAVRTEDPIACEGQTLHIWGATC